MTTTQFDLAAAKQKASTKSDEDLELSFGGAGIALDGILEQLIADPTLSPAQKTIAFQTIMVNASGIVEAATQGTRGPIALGSSSKGAPDSVTLSKEDYDELVNEKDAAVAQNKVWRESRETLDKVSLDLNLQIPHDSNLPYPKDFDKKILKAIEDKEAAAKASASGIDDKKVRATLNDVKSAVDAQKVTGLSRTTIDGKDAVKTKVDEVAKALGLSPAPATP